MPMSMCYNGLTALESHYGMGVFRIAIEALHFYPMCGLFDELYNPCKMDLVLTPLRGANDLYRVNGLFWGQLLSNARIDEVIGHLQDKHAHSHPTDIKEAAILANPALFKRRLNSAIDEIVDQSTPEPLFFGAIESINILCKLYSDMVFYPYTITVADGFIVNEYSSKDLIVTCLLPGKNPYLPFLRATCFPIIAESDAEIAWIHGPIRMSTMAMACMAKKQHPHMHISIIDHSSEYYSMTKIARFLKRNSPLFRVIDSIILEDDQTTKEALETAIIAKMPLSSVPNVLYKDASDNSIHQTVMNGACNLSFSRNMQLRTPSHQQDSACIDPSTVACGKLAPSRICPWRKCSFCGINQKYYRINCLDEPLEQKIEAIRDFIKQGVRYFWFFDEVATPEQLSEFAQALLDAGISIIWHCRSRIDERFDLDLCELLARSGLREIRFGLESASAEIQQMMNKFEVFSPVTAENLVRSFSAVGVGVHFPIIIGMPNETNAQRQETYAFLRKLRRTYSGFTFNINILEMDVSSALYTDFERYGITGLKLPCDPAHFLGNAVETWADDRGWFSREQLSVEQNAIMRELMFPWMPQDAITPPNIHYRLTETIRNTLIWKSLVMEGTAKKPTPLTEQTRLVLSPWVVVLDEEDEKKPKIVPNVLTSAYDFRYTYSVFLDAACAGMLLFFSEPHLVGEAIEHTLMSCTLADTARDELGAFVLALYENHFLFTV